MKTIILSGLVAMFISACGKVAAEAPAAPAKPGCMLCELELTAVTERAGTMCLSNELLRGLKGNVAVCVKPSCKCCH